MFTLAEMEKIREYLNREENFEEALIVEQAMQDERIRMYWEIFPVVLAYWFKQLFCT